MAYYHLFSTQTKDKDITMRAREFLHTLLEKSSIKLDKRIIKTLCLVAHSSANHRCLTLVKLGRSLLSFAKIKHRIKRVDRLLGNKMLHQNREAIYALVNRQLLIGKKNPYVLVDWSGLTPCGKYHMLRASLPCGGRALTVYEQVWPEKYYGSRKAHLSFLKALKRSLPTDCRPIIITDAGFRCPWFRLVLSLGWNYIGRVRHNTLCSKHDKKEWKACKLLYSKASGKPKCLGSFFLSKSNALLCHLFIAQSKKKYRIKKNLRGKKTQSSASKKHEKNAREPWLLASSLTLKPQQVILAYRQRMQIEESFRDLKNTRNGLGFRHARTLIKERLEILLLIAHLALLLLWAIGLWAQQKCLHYQLQTNSIKTRKVLSACNIGYEILKLQYKPSQQELQRALYCCLRRAAQ